MRRGKGQAWVDNDRVRALENRMQPHEETPMHSHPAHVAIAIRDGFRDGRFKFTTSDGKSSQVELKAGHVLFFDAVTHRTENVGNSESHAFLVELK